MKRIIISLLIFFNLVSSFAQQQTTFKQYIETHVPSKAIIDTFLNGNCWAKFDPELGYTLGNYLPHEGINNSSNISTSQPDGTRTSFVYKNRPCRINTYGDSFTQCQQVNDGETWQEYLAAHLGEPVRNFGMGGYGVYQAYRRMLREEQTKDSAQYVMLYIWGDDHIRSLFRCRYMNFCQPADEQSEEGKKSFHGNFWPNIEMDFNTKQFVEYPNLITTREDLYKMTNAEWMVKNLKPDLALQMSLYSGGKIDEIDFQKLKQLSKALDYAIDLDNPATQRENVSKLLTKYSFAATKYTLNQTNNFARSKGKKLMVILFDPYNVTLPMLTGEVTSETRYDKEIVDYLQTNGFTYFDMNTVHVQDYKCFNLPVRDYFRRYFLDHYNPAGNHFFAYAIAPRLIDWLNPKPFTYQNTGQKTTDFRSYLNIEKLDNKHK